jgi:oxygen-independent coproporphyrinogen-3 oxidase
MAGIYIHIPFCRKACHYCNFHFSTSLNLKTDLISALLRETELCAQSGYLGKETIQTIYFGGGTPSLLSEEELLSILSTLQNHFFIDPSAEITLETNPDDITVTRLAEWKKAGINRLSIGVQSFFDEDLRWMNRAHNSAQAVNAILAAQQEGFHNITIDLIFGTPTLTDAHWQHNVAQAILMEIPHLSCYALTVEPSTALHKMIKAKKVPEIDPEKQAGQFLMLMDWLNAAGYEHYEISNFSKPGMRSRHNSSYWKGSHYLGLGPSAHSFNGRSRQWNVANNVLYIQSLNNNTLPFETEALTETQMLNEYLMTSLRTMEGTDLQHIKNSFGHVIAGEIERSARKYILNGKVVHNGNALQLTREGKLYADGIAADLFRD